MTVHILDALARGGFEQVIALHDRHSGLRGFLGLHDTSSGPAFGGIRRWEYIDERQALLDCLRLAASMTHKCVLAEVPGGGAKLVLLDRQGVDLPAAYRHIGRVVESLAGRFYTGPDVGTGAEELGYVAEHTSYVTKPGPEGPGDLAGATAEGVFAGIGAALCQLDGEEDWSRRKVVIQGLGGVGSRLAKRLVERGVCVLGADTNTARAERVAEELGLECIDPAAEFDVECDVFSPCALGGILHDLTVKRLQARIVAGAANNVLAKALHGDRLHERGILYVPDFVINSGALIRGASFHLEGTRENDGEIERRVGRAATTILQRAAAEELPPARVAVREAEGRLEARRAARSAPPPAPPHHAPEGRM